MSEATYTHSKEDHAERTGYRNALTEALTIAFDLIISTGQKAFDACASGDHGQGKSLRSEADGMRRLRGAIEKCHSRAVEAHREAEARRG